MTTDQQRLKELKQQVKELTQQINQLEGRIINTQPTTGLLGRWAKHPEHGDVLIAEDRASDRDGVYIVYLSDDTICGTLDDLVPISDLTFPEQTTRPQDVPVGEAWLVDATDGHDQTQRAKALKVNHKFWTTSDGQPGDETQWCNHEITLITPLIPACPQDKPKTVTTEDEYGTLPEGSIVTTSCAQPWTRFHDSWTNGEQWKSDREMARSTRHVLRQGWGK